MFSIQRAPCGLQSELPARPIHGESPERVGSGPEPEKPCQDQRVLEPPNHVIKLKGVPCLATPQCTWEMSPGLPSAALASQATAYKYWTVALHLYELYIVEYSLKSESNVGFKKGHCLEGRCGFPLFLLTCKVNSSRVKQKDLVSF